MGGEEPADEGLGDTGGGEHGAEEPLISPALAWRNHVGDRRLRAHDQAAAAQCLDRAEHDELGEVAA